MGLFKLGFITILLSDSLVSGYTAAAAFTIMITQIKFLFGLPRDQAAIPSGPFVTPKVGNSINNGLFQFYTNMYSLWITVKSSITLYKTCIVFYYEIVCLINMQRVIRFFELIFIRRVVNGAAIVTSIICIILLIGLDYVNSLLRKYVKKFPIHIPAQLIVVNLQL